MMASSISGDARNGVLCATVLKVLLLAIAIGLLGAIFPVHANTLSPEVKKGLIWLQAQVQATGSLLSETASVATPKQSRAEVAVTLGQLDVVPQALADKIAADTDGTVETTARQILAARANGAASAELAPLLADRQDSDGGFGGVFGYVSNVLDTAFALSGFKAIDGTGIASSNVASALAYLTTNKTIDAGWGVDNGQGQVYVTALVLMAMHDWRTEYAVAATTLAARDWLLGARNGGVFDSVLDNGMGLLALTTQTTDPSVLNPIASALRATQSADGSWNGDPFLTAIALRALWNTENAPPAATTGSIAGTLVDADSGNGIADVTVQLLERPEVTIASNSTGGFALSGVAPGTLTLRVTKAGYASGEMQLIVVAGQTTNVGTWSLVPAPLTAAVTGIIKNSAGKAISGAVVSVGTVSALTNAEGNYSLAGVPPGSATISVTAYGYTQTTSTAVDFSTGMTYVFSPTLYTGTPPATELIGSVINAETGTAIVDASIRIGVRTAVTAADGKFSFPGVDTGTYSATISAEGYQTITVTGTLVAGVNNIGSVNLSKLVATTTLSGKLTDAKDGTPLVGATVSAQGQTATTAADGSYTLTGITTTVFDLMGSASGYLSLTQHVALSHPGNATVNLAMTKEQPAGIAIEAVTPSKASYLPSEMLQVQVLVRNTTDQAVDTVVSALILDADNSVAMEIKANAHGLGNNPPNLPVTVPASDTVSLDLSQLLLRHPAGKYTILARAYDSKGRAVAEGHGAFTVSAQAILGGGVIVDPPLVQSGTKTPIHFVAQASNLGNQAIAAGELALTVILDNPDPQQAQVSQVEVATVGSGAPYESLVGLARDAAGNLYSVSGRSNDGRVFKTTPDGQVSVAYQVPTASPNNPTLTDIAIDSKGNFWLTNNNRGIIWVVDPKGTLTKVELTTLTSLSGISVDAQGNAFVTGQMGSEHRLVKRDTAGIETVLWANGLSTPTGVVKDKAGNLVVTNNADGSLSRIDSQGKIVPFVRDLKRPMGITKDAAGNFYVANNGDHSIVKVTPDGTASVYATDLNGPVDLQFDNKGVLFVTCQGDNAIRKVATDGSVSVFTKSLASAPRALKYDATGNLYIANGDGVVRKYGADGQLGELASGLNSLYGLALESTGTVLVTNYSNGRLHRIDAGVATVLSSGLSNPWGVATNGSEILVAELNKNSLKRLDISGNAVGDIRTLINSPRAVAIDSTGNVIVANGDGLVLIEKGVARRFYDAAGIRYIAPDPAGGAVYLATGNDIYRVAYDGTSAKLNSAAIPFYIYGLAVKGVYTG